MDRFRRISPTAARLVLAAIFMLIGLNGLLHFAPTPEPTPEGGAFLGALGATGYMIPLIKGTEVVAALLLLFRRTAPLALVVLAPISVNILAFHVFLDPGGVPVAMFVVALGLYAAWHERAAYRALFEAAERGAARELAPSIERLPARA